MIKKATSKDLMNILETSQLSISNLIDNVNNIQTELEKRLLVIKNTQEYNNNELESIKEILSNEQTNNTINKTIVISKAEIMSGIYDKYGNTVHASFLKTPYDIFNFGSVTGKIFKNNVNIKINDIIKEEYSNMLKDDSIKDKSVFFEEYDEPNIKLEIEINPSDLLGATSFNTIDFLPFLSGSFNIEQIDIYTMQDYQTKATLPSLTITNKMNNIGMSRLLLDKTRDLWKISFNIHVNFKNSNNKYPFGLKHLYFLKADLNPNSNIIFKVKQDNYIDWISEDIVIHDQNGRYETTCTDQNIKLYMSYVSGVLSYEIDTSKGLSQNPLNRNIKEFYVSMPVLKSINSIKFAEIKNR